MSAKNVDEFDLDSNPTGYSSITDELNGWVIANVTRGYEYVTVLDSSTGHITLLEDFPTDWENGDTINLYRHFHDNATFAPSWTDPISLKVGNNIVTSGGQGSTVGYKPIWSGLVNQTWFPDASRSPSYNQTYASELELKNSQTWLNPQNTTDAGGGSLTADRRFWIGFVWETFDGMRSNMFHPTTAYIDAVGGGTSKLSCNLFIQFARMDKRARYVHVFMAETDTSIAAATDIDWVNWFFIETHDMCDAASGFAYVNATETDPAYYSKTVDLDLPDWNAIDSESGDLKTFLGHTKPNRTTVSFSHGLVSVGRLFVTKYYDFNASLNYNDAINYTTFAGNGVSQWAKLMDIDDAVQTTIEAGDPSNVKALAVDDGRLVILKDTGSFYIDLTYSPTAWILRDISRQVGCDAPDSVVTTPFGTIWAHSADGVYLWRGGDPIEISRNWRTSSIDYGGSPITTGFRSLVTTYVAQWQGWYDPFYRSYRLMYTADGTDKKTVYEAFLDVQDEKLQGLPIWTKHALTHNVGHVLLRSDNVPYFSDDSTKSYSFSGTATDDAGTAIAPYLDTGVYVLNEENLLKFKRWWLAVKHTGTPTGTLDIQIEVDTVQHEFSAVTKTNTRFASKFPIVGRSGTGLRFRFNKNATRALMGTAYTIHELGFEYEVVKRGGDVAQSL